MIAPRMLTSSATANESRVKETVKANTRAAIPVQRGQDDSGFDCMILNYTSCRLLSSTPDFWLFAIRGSFAIKTPESRPSRRAPANNSTDSVHAENQLLLPTLFSAASVRPVYGFTLNLKLLWSVPPDSVTVTNPVVEPAGIV